MEENPIAILTPAPIGNRWIAAFENEAPERVILLNETISKPEDVELLLVWKHHQGSLKIYFLKLLYSLYVDHLVVSQVPKKVPICRT